MNQEERLTHLLNYFISENRRYDGAVIPEDINEQKRLLRSLMNVRPPLPLHQEMLEVQDAYLQEELRGKIISLSSLTPVKPHLYLWQGDITTLGVDGIVNAANSDMLGCFHPCHGCIDNVIHTFAGIQLRLACNDIMAAQNKPESTGKAKITSAYNLPSNFVLHTVGPIVRDQLESYHCEGLKKCYESCLELAVKEGLHSIAFCCISTGEFHFPQDVACEIAVDTVTAFLGKNKGKIDVIFNVFKDKDLELYEKKLATLP